MEKLTVIDMYGSASQKAEQDFQLLRDSYKNEVQKFEDWEFPPGDDSLGELEFLSALPDSKIVWKRPHELVREWDHDPKAKPVFIGPNGVGRFDITQGGLGDCWYLSSLAELATEKELFQVVVPDNNKTGFDDGNYSGAFHFRYWRAGVWTDVVIDDRLPCVKDKEGIHRLIFTTVNHNEFWTVLAEKAYAKLYGTYEQIEGGLQTAALEDFTGGVSILKGWDDNFDVDELNVEFRDTLRRAHKRRAFIGVGSKAGGDEASGGKDEGISEGHAYSVTGVEELIDKNEQTHFLLRLRNPWGCYEWTGKWSDSDDASWATVPHDLRRRDTPGACALGGGCDDGEFWISLEDVIRKYDQMSICYWSPKAYEGRLKRITHPSWDVKMLRGAWTSGQSYDPYSVKADLVHFPKATVQLSRSNDSSDPIFEKSDSSECTMAVALIYELYNKAGEDETMPNIGFRIFKVPENRKGKPYDVSFFETATEITEEDIPLSYMTREINKFFKLEEGTYCIVPFVDTPPMMDECDAVSLPFLLRIYSERKITTH